MFRWSFTIELWFSKMATCQIFVGWWLNYMIKQQQQFNNNAFQYILTISSSHVFIIFFFLNGNRSIYFPMFQCSKEVLWSWWAWKRNDVPSWRRRSSTVSSAGSKRKIPRVWSVDPMVLEWCNKNNLGRRCFWDGRVSIDLWYFFGDHFDVWYVVHDVSDVWHHEPRDITDVESWTAESMEQWKTWSPKPKGQLQLQSNLIGGLEHLIIFPYISHHIGNHHPNWLSLHHFSEGWLNHQPEMCCGIEVLSLEPLWIHLSGYQLTMDDVYGPNYYGCVFHVFHVVPIGATPAPG